MRWTAYVGCALRCREESREESAVRLGDTRLGPGPLHDAVVPRPEAELQYVSLGRRNSVGSEGEAVSANRNGDRSGAGPQSEHSSEDELTEHSD